MNTISNFITNLNLLLFALGLISFIIKIVLFYKVEKEWDSIRFLHFSKIDLKMTVSKDLRNWRKRQNMLTNIFATFITLYGMSYFFQMIISS